MLKHYKKLNSGEIVGFDEQAEVDMDLYKPITDEEFESIRSPIQSLNEYKSLVVEEITAICKDNITNSKFNSGQYQLQSRIEDQNNLLIALEVSKEKGSSKVCVFENDKMLIKEASYSEILSIISDMNDHIIKNRLLLSSHISDIMIANDRDEICNLRDNYVQAI